MTRGGNLTLIVILLILWFVGIFLAGYFGYEHFDKGKKTETNLILFALGVVLAIGTFIGIIVVFIKRSRLPKNPVSGSASGANTASGPIESMPMMGPGAGYPGPDYSPVGYPSYPAQNFPGASYGMQSQMMPVAPSFQGGYPGVGPGAGYPVQNPYLAQQYSI